METTNTNVEVKSWEKTIREGTSFNTQCLRFTDSPSSRKLSLTPLQLHWVPLQSNLGTEYSVSSSVCESRSVVSDSATPCTVARQAPLSMGLSRQEYWSGLPFPPPGDLPNPGIKLNSPILQADSLPLSHLRSPKVEVHSFFFFFF